MAIKNYIKGFLAFSLGTWIRALISFFTTPVVSYLIVPEEFGKASMFSLVYNVAYLISLMGLDEAFMRFYREVENEKRKNLFWEALCPPLILATLLSAGFVFFEKKLSAILFQSYYPFVGWLLSLSLITGVFKRFIELSVRMQKRGLAFSSIQIVSSISNFLITVLFATFIRPNFYAIIAGLVAGNVGALIYGFLIDKESRGLPKFQLSIIKDLLSYGIPLVPSSLIFWLFTSMDRIALRQYSNFTEMGLYTAAFKVVSAMNLIQTGFLMFWKPVALENYTRHPEDREFYRKAFLVISFAMYTFGLVLIAFKDILFLLFAKSYRSASYIAPFLILMPTMNIVSEVTVMGINFSKKTYWHIVISSVSALTNYIGNTLLVPVLGGKGAAISTGISYIVFFATRTVISKRLYDVKYDLGKIIVGNAVMISVALIGTFRRSMLETILAAFAGILVILFLYRREVRSLLKRKKELQIFNRRRR